MNNLEFLEGTTSTKFLIFSTWAGAEYFYSKRDFKTVPHISRVDAKTPGDGDMQFFDRDEVEGAYKLAKFDAKGWADRIGADNYSLEVLQLPNSEIKK